MFESITGAAGAIWGLGGLILGAAAMFTRVQKARREVEDVISLAQKFVAKYKDVDDDARQLAKEIEEAVAAIGAIPG